MPTISNKEQVIIHAIATNNDPYLAYASYILQKSIERITEPERQAAKREIYFLIYSEAFQTKLMEYRRTVNIGVQSVSGQNA